MNHTVRIIEKNWLTPNVMRLVLSKPLNYEYKIGQAVDLTIDSPQFIRSFAPFTLTSLSEDENLEVILKIYKEHKGLTYFFSHLKIDDWMILSPAWDSYEYRGPGIFIAAGSGITPFIPMIRDLRRKNILANHKLIYANRTSEDIILVDEINSYLGKDFINILSREKKESYDYGKITRDYLQAKINNFKQAFYLCGPQGFSEALKQDLIKLGAIESMIQIGY